MSQNKEFNLVKIFDGRTLSLGNGEEKVIYVQIAVAMRDYMHLFSPSAWMVFTCLLMHIDKNQWCYPSVELIEKETGIGATTIYKALSELEQLELDGNRILLRVKAVNKGRQFQNNRYILFPTHEQIANIEVGSEVVIDDEENILPAKPTVRKELEPIESIFTFSDTEKVNTKKNHSLSKTKEITYKENPVSKEDSVKNINHIMHPSDASSSAIKGSVDDFVPEDNVDYLPPRNTSIGISERYEAIIKAYALAKAAGRKLKPHRAPPETRSITASGIVINLAMELHGLGWNTASNHTRVNKMLKDGANLNELVGYLLKTAGKKNLNPIDYVQGCYEERKKELYQIKNSWDKTASNKSAPTEPKQDKPNYLAPLAPSETWNGRLARLLGEKKRIDSSKTQRDEENYKLLLSAIEDAKEQKRLEDEANDKRLQDRKRLKVAS